MLAHSRQADEFPRAEIMWVQEEPKNMGSWSYVNPRLEAALLHTENHRGERARYVGRHPCASVATGNKHVHYDEQDEFLTAALSF
jgi:2-oxoglutarate dehydrogenase E1 component